MRRDTQIAGAGIALLVLGAIGPWVTVEGFSEGGLDSDGVITLVLALGAAVLVGLAFRAGKAPSWIGLAISAVLCLAISILDISDVSGTDLGVPGFEPSVGWGLWLTLVGSIVLGAAAAIGFMNRDEQPAAS